MKPSFLFSIFSLLVALAGCQQCSTSISTPARASPEAKTLVGLWESIDDKEYTREFSNDGRVFDKYQSDSAIYESGTYEFVDPATEVIEAVSADLLKDMKVLKVTFSDSVLYYSLVKLTKASLELGFLSGRGNTLSFKRIK